MVFLVSAHDWREQNISRILEVAIAEASSEQEKGKKIVEFSFSHHCICHFVHRGQIQLPATVLRIVSTELTPSKLLQGQSLKIASDSLRLFPPKGRRSKLLHSQPGDTDGGKSINNLILEIYKYCLTGKGKDSLFILSMECVTFIFFFNVRHMHIRYACFPAICFFHRTLN